MKSDLKTGAAFLAVSSFVFIITGYLTNIFLGRFLGPSLYGTYGVIISVISILNILQTSGFTQAAAKFIAEDERKSDSIFLTTFRIQNIFTIAMCVLIYTLSYPLSIILKDASLAHYLKFASLIFPLYGFYALLIDHSNGMHQFRRQALLNIVYSISKLLLVLFLGFLFKLYGALAAFVISPLVAILAGFYYPKRRNISSFSYRKLLTFSFPLVTFALLSTILQSVDLYFVKAMLDDNDSGYYTASQNISRITYFATIALSGVMLPSISRSLNLNLIEKLNNTIKTSVRLILLLIIPGSLVLSATSTNILHLIYSNVYIPASGSLSILSLSMGFFSLFFLLCTILNGAGKPKITALLSIVGVIANSILCYLLIPSHSLIGAAYSSLLSNILVSLLACLIILNKFKVLVSFRNVINIFSASLVIYGIAMYIKLPFLFLPIQYVFLFALYIGILFFIKEIRADDIEQVKAFIPRKFKSN